MAVWLIVLAGISLAAWWLYTRRLAWQFKHIKLQLSTITQKRQVGSRAGKASMRSLYRILHTSLIADKADDAYQALDLLKLALGQGLGRDGEPARLTAVIYLALRTNQLDVAGHCIDAFRPLLKNMTVIELPVAIEQLGLIAVMSLKQRQNFLAARAVDVIFSVIGIQDEAACRAVIRAIRLTGLTALRRKDTGLVHEILVKLASWLATEQGDSPLHEQAAGVLTAWLHRIVKAGNVPMFELITQYIDQLAEKNTMSEKALASFIVECAHLSSMDSLDPFSQLNGQIAMFSLELAVKIRNVGIWRQSLDGVVQAARLAVNQRSLTESFTVIYPLFEIGRRLLAAELSAASRRDLFRQKALYLLIRECLQLVEFVSRQNFTTTIADIIEQIYQEWIKCPLNPGQHKSIKRFCQLLFLYCTRIKRRQKMLLDEEGSFNAENVITVADREHLKTIGYLS
ncbi:hypothetical protein SOV_24230 [Sporomusa ovata DSM 2662]|uniref:Uncharacterized protein n=1 Tax=Sporomusa ovata TaxID=2378 RepID=A0A0U1L3Q7_9FIRM|nr:hypothetical protein [Sporomusa ovata]EQB25739.1 hypothetical protein SOV_4c04020 [Sporomusa ovata DSM 2662]CQR74300.1 hypothetical protein SpAn4DRAFT_0762 [Sporomusa ovata]